MAQFGIFRRIRGRGSLPPKKRSKSVKPIETRLQYKHSDGTLFDVSNVDLMHIRAGTFRWSSWNNHVFKKNQPPPFETLFGPVDLNEYTVYQLYQ